MTLTRQRADQLIVRADRKNKTPLAAETNAALVARVDNATVSPAELLADFDSRNAHSAN
jgi:hypothetical protein